jgi:hypothetical protein
MEQIKLVAVKRINHCQASRSLFRYPLVWKNLNGVAQDFCGVFKSELSEGGERFVGKGAHWVHEVLCMPSIANFAKVPEREMCGELGGGEPGQLASLTQPGARGPETRKLGESADGVVLARGEQARDIASVNLHSQK